MVPDNLVWEYRGDEPNPYVVEWQRLLDAIRKGKPHNEARRAGEAEIAALMGRIAAHSGQEITWDQVMKSEFQFVQDIDNMTFDTPAPIQEGPDGLYFAPQPTNSERHRRRAEFQVRTPDPHLNALLNWERCRSDYHRQGPALVLSGGRWDMAYHISVGWYGKMWAGDHETVADCLRLYAALQGDDGAILGIGPSLTSWAGETAAHYWVDHVWRHHGKPIPINRRAHGLSLTMPPAPRLVETAPGWELLTSGREADSGKPPAKNLLALSSWRPYPFPAGAVIPMGMRCEKLCLLLQNYVHPLKNYVPNGEVVLNYAEGAPTIESLIPPYNLDTYYQAFSRAGVSVPFGKMGRIPHAWAFPPGKVQANANALEIACDPARNLESTEIRATCSEGIIGLAALAAISAKH